MEDEELTHRAHKLTDIELALLLSLVARQHCLLETDKKHIDNLEAEIQLVRKALSPVLTSQAYRLPGRKKSVWTACCHCRLFWGFQACRFYLHPVEGCRHNGLKSGMMAPICSVSKTTV